MAKDEGMVGSKSRLYPAGIALFLALALIAMTLPTGSLAATIHLRAHLNGAQEAPPVASPATGVAALTLNTLTGQLEGSLTFAGLI
ncbi:MAG: CHRD domain-containing protein, partial [Deltaproteobacteria bacterium]|nr:CHRD domain-containing protein [Deltaproteobacteria bacterium]